MTKSLSKQELIGLAIQNPDIVSQELARRNAERCKEKFFYFFKHFWPEYSHDELKVNWHMEYIADQLQILADRVGAGLPKENDLIINVPPGSTKTAMVSIMFPIWCWINWPWMRFITLSYSGDLSLESADYCREIIRSEKFKLTFPDIRIKSDKDNKSNFRIVYKEDGVIKLGGNRFSTSVGAKATGFHAHIIIVDDPLDAKQALSVTELKSTNKWLDNTLPTRKVDKAVTPTISVQQRLHQDDPTGHALEKKKDNLLHICLPGEIITEKYRAKVSPPELIDRYIDGLLDPERMPLKVLKELEKDIGQYGYAAQVGQDPTPPSGGMFKVDCLHVVDTMPSEVSILSTVRFWDKAGTQGAGAFSAGCKMSKLANGKVLIHDMKRGQWGTDERENQIKKTAEADGSKVSVYIEQEPGSGGKESAESTIRNLAGYSVYADRPTGDKVFRADPFSVAVNNGDVLLLHGDWISEFKEEMRYFPFSKYKDQVDAASAAYAKLVKKKIAKRLI